MGKGDKKTKKGKIIMGSYGVRRPRNKSGNPASPKVLDQVEDEVQEDGQKEVKPKPKAKASKKTKEEE